MNLFGIEIPPKVQIFIFGFLTLAFVTHLYYFIVCRVFRYRCNVNMNGKTVIVTGASGGIGKETVRTLAERGARVILAVRNIESGKQVRDEIAAATKNKNLVVKKLDLSSQKSVKEFAEDILRTEQRLDVLVHNAATAENKIVKTEDGLELTMATNHFGPFLLTHLLLDLLKKTAPSRIVVVASSLYRLRSLDLNNINPDSSWCVPTIYYLSKHANISFTLELARRLEGSGVTANCLHPGMIDSGIWRNIPEPFKLPIKFITTTLSRTPEQGSQTTVFLSCSEEVKTVTGKYFVDCKETSLSSAAMDMSKAKTFWELSEKFVKI